MTSKYDVNMISRMLKGRSLPGKVLLSRHPEPFDISMIHGSPSPKGVAMSVSQNDAGPSAEEDDSTEVR